MLISPDEVKKSLASKGWKYADMKISKSYAFDRYMDGIKFVQKMAELAERNNHHPDITIRWCKVDVIISSHSMGGVTTNCINLAMGVDHIFKK